MTSFDSVGAAALAFGIIYHMFLRQRFVHRKLYGNKLRKISTSHFGGYTVIIIVISKVFKCV